MIKKSILFIRILLVSVTVFSGVSVFAQQQTITVRASDITQRATLYLAPRAGDVIEGSVFDVAVLLNTHGASVNALELNLSFPTNMLAIVKPSGEKSFISVWVEPPTFSNVNGTARFAGVMPNGIATESGLITKITFKALATGEATVKILSSSQVLANDGMGSPLTMEYGRGIYHISPRPPDGVRVFSETHPFESQWYNNKSPIIAWEGSPDISDYSFVLDNKPFTIPDDQPDSKETAVAYTNLPDGLLYFHIKARRQGVWGATTNFLLRIDSSPPAAFSPKAEFLTASIIDRVLVTFSPLIHYRA